MTETTRQCLNQEGQAAEMEKSRARRGRLGAALERLTRRLGAAAPGREREWTAGVATALGDLQVIMRDRVQSREELLEDIQFSAPHLWNAARRVLEEYTDLEHQAMRLRSHLEAHGAAEIPDYRDLRERIGWLVTAIQHQQSLETDLIYEVYHRDIGVGD